MSIFKNLIDSSTGTAVFINADQIAFVVPTSSGGSRSTFVGPVSEGHPVSVSVTAPRRRSCPAKPSANRLP
ncbi:hypothetical protein QA633_43625 [Bradyrhizobium barranii]|uniref:hypothetical protein n=1 Tax=Bradyrhizobium barranii TaxID=2992140 RepID=UPI0024AF97AC|nr:hypothetical protein [Bradyrhizobium barranii]WFT95064.1 hypothetical protein QA633_43625 [Bradyrhizobium barranii]